ncbi:MAG: SAM-dependent methyltransferase [Gammaproteobacteria bacterium]|nr:SAM-dependent methyltransferase [Gammaproteobacteria bacterium]
MTIAIQRERPPWFSIAMLSMTALAYEILLMRLFSIIQWHHFAYMIISLALLGYACSGSFLTLARQFLLAHFKPVYLLNIVLFGISSWSCFLLSQQLHFNAEEMLWHHQQVFRLLLIYLLLALPFFFVANAIGLSLIRYHSEMSRIYAADLFGAGLGSLVIIVLLFISFPGNVLKTTTALAMLAAMLASWELYRDNKHLLTRLLSLLLVATIVPFVLPDSFTQLEISPYKTLKQSLNISGTKIITERSSPLGLISVVESPLIPFRHAPGLSLKVTAEPPEQLAVFVDAGAMTVITRNEKQPDKLSYLNQTSSALAYHLSSLDDVLIIGGGGGSEVLLAQYHHVKQISVVELNRQLINLVQHEYEDFSGNLYDAKNVNIINKEARGYVTGNDKKYDLIQLSLIDSFSASSAGLYALSESYLYTVEALQQYLNKLKPGAYLSITRWMKLPPRDSLKLFATAIEALRHNGHRSPGQQLILIRGLQTTTLLISNSAISSSAIQSLKKFSHQQLFDLAYYPGISQSETNQYNVLAKPYFYQGATALLGNDSDDFIKRYKFNLQPATDDRPFFFQFFKWGVFSEIMSLAGKGGMPLFEWGYLILVATLIQALLASIVLILLPLFLCRSIRQAGSVYRIHYYAFFYFLALGLAFLFIEIAFIQKFILFLHHPVFSISVVLAAFLIFAGAGSLWSKRYISKSHYQNAISCSLILIIVIASSYSLLLGPLFSLLTGLPTLLKIIISALLIAPLAFFMGMPFPLGLSRLAEINSQLLPWVWAVNGCASVLSAVLATLLAVHFGFMFVIMLALLFYGFSLFCFSTGFKL